MQYNPTNIGLYCIIVAKLNSTIDFYQSTMTYLYVREFITWENFLMSKKCILSRIYKYLTTKAHQIDYYQYLFVDLIAAIFFRYLAN